MQTIIDQTGLGQYAHHYAATVSHTEIANELRSRGYSIEPHVPPPVPVIHHVAMTKPRAIAIACDEAIVQYGIVHTSAHPYRCPSYMDARCRIPEATWNTAVSWATSLANYYMAGGTIPSWAQSFMVSGFGDGDYDLGFGDYDLGFGLGGFMDWVQENPEVLSIIGAGFAAAGAALTARRVSELLKQNIPKDYLTKADLPQILAALQGQAQPGQADALSKGAQAATLPTWMWPVLVGGGVVALILVMGRR